MLVRYLPDNQKLKTFLLIKFKARRSLKEFYYLKVSTINIKIYIGDVV